MVDTFTSLPKLFVDEMIKMDKLLYQSCGSVIKSCQMEQRQSIDETNLYCKIRRLNTLSYVGFSKL